MNKPNAGRTFTERLGELSRLPLITDTEMGELFWEEVIAGLAELDRYNQEKQLCANCANRCCVVAHCELYTPQFSVCPIHDFRPLICRFHYCHRFQTDCGPLIDGLTEVLFECLLAANREGNPRVRMFDSPPLARNCPTLVEAAANWIKEVKEGKLNPEKAVNLIHCEAERYRMAPLP